MEVGLSDSGMAGGKVVDLVGLCLKLGGVGVGGGAASNTIYCECLAGFPTSSGLTV